MKYIAKLSCLLLISSLLSFSSFSQTTEDFEGDVVGATTFDDNGQNFTITNGAGETNYDIETFAGGGWNGTAADNNFVDNSGTPTPILGDGSSFTVTTTNGTDIFVNSLYLFMSQFNLSAASGFSVTIEGRKNGLVVYTIVKNSGFSNTTTFTPNNGFTLVNFATQGGVDNSNTAVDELRFSTTGNADYIALDGFNWELAPACAEPSLPSVTSSGPICAGGNATITISGSLNDATQWHMYTGFCAVTPAGTTAGNTFVVSPSSTTSYFIRGEGGCATPGTCGAVNVTVNPTQNANFNYSAAVYCADDADPTPLISGVGGGTFTSTAGLSLNSGTGAIDVSASTPGAYTVGYTTPGPCPGSSNQSVTINALDDAAFNYSAAAYCANDTDPTPTITGLGGGTFSSTGGLTINAGTGVIDLSTSTPGTYLIMYTTSGTCPNSSSVSVSVDSLDDASFDYGGTTTFCNSGPDPIASISGLGGGTFSAGAGLSINASTGTIDVSTSTPGTYTVSYTTTGPCPNSSGLSITINGLDDASFNYDMAAYCVDATDPTPTITGVAGGTFSSTAGLSINAGTGVIDVSASTPGTYTVTYTTTGACANSSNVSVTVNALDDASFNYAAAAYCADDTDPTPTITGLGSGTFSSTAGLSINATTGSIDVSASTPGTYTVTYATAGSCPNSSNVSVTINALDDASFFYSGFAHCANAADPMPIITGLPGGTFSSTAGLSINASTGTVDVSASTPGTYVINYTTSGTCPNSSAVSMAINALDDASFNYSAASYCSVDADPTPTVNGLGGGSFSSTAGLSINASTGVIDLSTSTAGSYTVTYTTAGFCPNSSSVTVTVNASDDASFNYSASSYCSAETDPTPTITGLGGGTFSSTAGLSINASTGVIDLSASTLGAYTVTYTTSGSCPNSSSVSVTVTSLDDASFNYSAASYCSDDSDPTPTITGLGGGTFTSTAGLSINTSTGVIDLSTSTVGTYSVTYTTSGSCPNSSNVSVTVNAIDDASFNYSASSYCAATTDPTPTITGLGGGTFSSTAGLSINASTGEIDLSTSTPGTYNVTYTTSGSCPNSSSVSVTVTSLDDASFNYSSASYCASAMNPTPTITGAAGGIFSSTAGLSINPSTGEIDLVSSTLGVYTVTYTTTGTCSNSSTQSVTINTSPNTPAVVTPITVCPGDDIILSATGSGTGNINFYDNATMGLLSSVAMPPATAVFNAGAFAPGTYAFDITEENGGCESASITIDVVVGDAIAPTAVCQDVTIFLDGSGTASILAGDIDGGSSDNCGAVTSSASQTSFDCSDVGGSAAGTLIISGAYDAGLTGGTPKGIELYASNDIADLSQYGIGSANNGGGTDGEEFTFPAVSVTAGTYIYVASESTQFTNFFGFAPDYTDGSMGINGDDAVELFHMGSVIDVFGDINTDGTGQPWDFLDGWAYRNSGTGPDGSTFTLGSWSFSGVNVYDNQTSNATTPSPMPIGTFTPASSGGTTVTLTVTDGSGNTSTCDATVTVLDTLAPAASCQDITVFLDGSGNASIIGSDLDNGTSDNCGVASMTASPTSFTCANVGANTVTLTVTDNSGNTSTCTSTVTVSDTISPTAVCQDIIVFLDGSGSATITGADIDGGSSDNCGTVTVSATPTTFSCAEFGANTVTLTATDGNGNMSNCTAMVTVMDTVSPVIVCPADQSQLATASCDFTLLDYTLSASASDNCGGTITLSQSPVAGTVITADQVVTISGIDANGNSSSCSFNIVLDFSACSGSECTNAIDLAPLDSCGDQTTETGSTVGGTTSTQTAFCGTSAGSGGANWYTFTGDGGTWTASTVDAGTNYDTKLWIYEGSCAALNCVAGNDDFAGTTQSQVSFVTTVGATYYVVVGGFSSNEGDYVMTVSNVEGIAPVPDAAILSDVTGECEVTSLTAPTATDNCSPTVTVTNNVTLPITAQGTTVVTWTYDDGNGNTATQTQNVILTDATAPVPDFATLADVTAECEITTLSAPTATDNCATTVTVTNDATLPITAQGTTVVTWTYDDGNGNTSTQTQNVVLTDVTAPVPDVATLSDVTADCDVTSLVPPTASDACGGTVTVTNDAVLPISGQGSSTITWTYTDVNGNASTQTQNIVIQDVTGPTPDVMTLSDVTGECEVTMLTEPTATDNCGGLVMVTNDATLPISTSGTTVVTWTYTDDLGNTSTQTQNVVITDVTSPVPDVTILSDLSTSCAIESLVAPTAMDNCAGAITGTTTTMLPITSATTIVWEFDDGNGNISTQNQTVVFSTIDVGITLESNGVTITASNPGGVGVSFNWLDCSSGFAAIPGATSQSYTATTGGGSYAVRIVENGCVDTSVCIMVTSVGLTPLTLDKLTVYPNPSQDGYFTVNYDGTIQAIDVVDMLGRVIDLPTDLKSGTVDGSELAYGRYMVRVTTDSTILTTEIVIAR